MYIYNSETGLYLCLIFVGMNQLVKGFDFRVHWCFGMENALCFSSEEESLATIDFLIDVYDAELEGILEIEEPDDEDEFVPY